MSEVIDLMRQGTQGFQQILSSVKLVKEETTTDPKLVSWLQGLGLHESSQKIFLAEGYTLDDVLYDITQDDLKRIPLKGGTRLRIWHAINQHRKEGTPFCNGDIQPIGTI